MNKRIMTTYAKLNQSIKKAIEIDNPYGIENRLTRMKHLIKGYLFEGFIYEYEDAIYLIEWSRITTGDKTSILMDEFDDGFDDELDGIILN